MLATDTLIDGRYRLGPIIGRGGGADVHRAEDLTSGNEVAIKVLRSANASDLKRFELEAETLRRLDHPAIVRMCDDGTHEGVPYLVLDLIDGESLSRRLERGALDETDVISFGTVLADALAHAHEIGVVHRDVKPGNVLFDADGAVHLTDFGIARLTDATAITSTGMVIGTAAYLAPEQVTGHGATPASDVYALGLVLIEALTATRAYPGSPSEAAIARLSRGPELPQTANRSLGALLGSMTAMEPHLRPTAAATRDTLDAAAVTDPDATGVLPIASDETSAIPIVAAPAAPAVSASAAPSPVAAALTRNRRPLVAAALIVGVIVLFLIGYAEGGSGGLVPPAGAGPSTSATIAPSTTAPPTTPATEAPRPKGKGHGKGNEDG